MSARKSATGFPEPPTPTGRLIGYARVSTPDQNVDMQIAALRRAGVAEQDIYHEHVSGVAVRRPQFTAALKACRRGDTLVFWKLDRVGRSLAHLVDLAADLSRRGVHLHSLTDGIDTTTSAGRFLFHILGAAAQLERDLISDRTKASLARKKERGERVGPDPKLSPKQIQEARRELLAGGDAGAIGKRLGVSRQTIYRRAKWNYRKTRT